MRPFEGLPKALRTLCVKDGRALQDIARASKISPAMLSSYLTGRESPTIKTLEKLLGGLELRLDALAAVLDEVQGYERPVPSTAERLLALPPDALDRLFLEQLTKYGVLPPKKTKRKS